MNELEIRRLGADEVRAAAPILLQLRSHLDEAELVRRIEMQRASGYELIGAFRNGSLVVHGGSREPLETQQSLGETSKGAPEQQKYAALAPHRGGGFLRHQSRDGVLVAVAGIRPVHTLARGPHLHVDDLVVDARCRGQGVGVALLQFCERDAGARGLVAVFLDSRQEVIGFYESLGYEPHTALLMRRRLP